MYDKSKPMVEVSVLSANYNNGEFLEDYFENILNYTVIPKEIVFIDDGSTDSSLDFIESKYKDLDLLKLIKLHENIGFANALNKSIDQVTSKYIMRLDPDDFIAEKKVEMQYNYLLKNTNIGFAGTNVLYYHHQKKKVIWRSNVPLFNERVDGLPVNTKIVVE